MLWKDEGIIKIEMNGFKPKWQKTTESINQCHHPVCHTNFTLFSFILCFYA